MDLEGEKEGSSDATGTGSLVWIQESNFHLEFPLEVKFMKDFTC